MKEAMKKSPQNLTWTRLESWVMAGVPDVLLQDKKGKFHFVELKQTTGKKVNLSPHQVSWLSTYQKGSVWILIKKQATQTLPEKFFLYHGSKARDLVFDGLNLEPDYCSENIDWEFVFGLICR
jgi:hypothetical protein